MLGSAAWGKLIILTSTRLIADRRVSLRSAWRVAHHYPAARYDDCVGWRRPNGAGGNILQKIRSQAKLAL
jgi:hypothetical protein